MEFIPELNDKQLDRLSEFLSNLSLLIIASLIIPNIFGGNLDINNLVSGVSLTIMFLTVSMVLVRKKDE